MSSRTAGSGTGKSAARQVPLLNAAFGIRAPQGNRTGRKQPPTHQDSESIRPAADGVRLTYGSGHLAPSSGQPKLESSNPVADSGYPISEISHQSAEGVRTPTNSRPSMSGSVRQAVDGTHQTTKSGHLTSDDAHPTSKSDFPTSDNARPTLGSNRSATQGDRPALNSSDRPGPNNSDRAMPKGGRPAAENARVAPGSSRSVAAGGPQRSKLNSLLRSSDYRTGSQEQGEGWKAVIHRYVSLYNQAETEQHVEVLDSFIGDADHCSRLRGRMERLRHRDLLRGCLPARGETKAELLRVNESSLETAVLLRMHMKRQMEQAGLYYVEEKSETERIWLSLEGAEWRIARVEPIIAERRPRFGLSEYGVEQDEFQDPEAFGEREILWSSTPYLNTDLFPQRRYRQAGTPYRRDLAASYADQWWNQANSSYEEFEVNCTNYTSQAIFAGNAPMNYTGKRDSGWWYKGRNGGREWWSYSWSVSNALAKYLTAQRSSGLRATVLSSAEELELGDIITYDWNGDGRFEHSTIVTAFDAAGMPLVNANTVPSRHRYWDYRDSYAWTEQTKYRFFHLADFF
ncbi:amidase domain-containing protein [Paenibacillus sp. NPDC058071]|uniref:amidase domain-containing protein n=1 Tax=Paenibacillus sp. NPDC058071 TaxID=3346326 RepID=UPI0036D992E9